MRFLMIIACGMGLILPILPMKATARPVSYPGGVTSMIVNNGERNSFHLHYSPTAQTSLGYKFEYWRKGEFTINALQINNLLKRWNQKNSQGNIYVRSGFGVAHKDSENDPVAFTGIAADWETQRFFTSYTNRYTEAGDIDDFYMQSARIGVAPYIGEYGDLHTWLMLEVEHKPESHEKVTITPVVRFFKGVHLIEGGISNQGDVLLNWIIRY